MKGSEKEKASMPLTVSSVVLTIAHLPEFVDMGLVDVQRELLDQIALESYAPASACLLRVKGLVTG